MRSRMVCRAARVLAPLLLAGAFAGDAAAQPLLRFADLDRLWSARRYADVLPLLERYRREAPYGKNELVDYMIATSACRVSGPTPSTSDRRIASIKAASSIADTRVSEGPRHSNNFAFSGLPLGHSARQNGANGPQ